MTFALLRELGQVEAEAKSLEGAGSAFGDIVEKTQARLAMLQGLTQ